MLLQTVHVTTESEWKHLLPRALSWVRNGLLVVGLGTEMQVYSQWKEEADSAAVDDPNFAPTTKIEMVGKILHLTELTSCSVFQRFAPILKILRLFLNSK